jgi:hypothetical protein
MGWFIFSHILLTIPSITNITRLSNQEKDLEILILHQQLSILQRKHTIGKRFPVFTSVGVINKNNTYNRFSLSAGPTSDEISLSNPTFSAG